MPYNFQMGRLFYLAAALAAAGCGKVAAKPDGPPVDVLQDSLTCTSPKLACGASCSDVMTDTMNCGACGTACQAAGELCSAGNCVDFLSSCATLKQAQMPSALYTLVDTSTVFCNMEDNMTYEAIMFGQYNVAVPGYDLISDTDLQNVTLQNAFVAIYNHQGGAKLLAPWTSTNCCFKFDASLNEIEFGTNYLSPFTTAGVAACSPSPTYADPVYRFGIGQSVVTPVPLAADFFTTNPVTVHDACGEGSNPAFFWKRHS
jgi:hypothetical protein